MTDTLTYSIGDIHGMLENLKKALEWIENDAGDKPATIVFHGDYIDRGPASAQVVQTCIDLKPSNTRTWKFIRGNHEDMLLLATPSTLDQVYDEENTEEFGHWLYNGGFQTLQSYGVEKIRDIPESHMKFFRKLDRWFEDDYRIYVHAGITPVVQPVMETISKHDLMWIREPFLKSTLDFGKVVVHGHTITSYDPLRTGSPWLPVVLNNRINIDTGAVFGGQLTVAKFIGTEHEFQQF